MLSALRLEVPDILEDNGDAASNLSAGLLQARRLPLHEGLQHCLGVLFRLNRCALTLLERQRALQSLAEEYRHYTRLIRAEKTPPALFVHLCGELAAGFKRLLLQILNGHKPSRPHLAWCLYMAEHFLAQALLRRSQEDLMQSRELLALSGRRSAASKVAGFLMGLAEAASDSSCHAAREFELPLTRGEMAGMLGLTIETVSRALTKFERDGVIKRKGARGIELLDPARLGFEAA